MECIAAKARAEKNEDDDLRVSLAVGGYRSVGAFHEEAWVWMDPATARELARDLISAAERVEDRNR